MLGRLLRTLGSALRGWPGSVRAHHGRLAYPLNVFVHVLLNEEGAAEHLHYGLFEHGGETLAAAQERSTQLLLQRLPPARARLLDVGVGLGTTLVRLLRTGHDAEGITPDRQQIRMLRSLHGSGLRVLCTTYERFKARSAYDLVLFQESSQYIDSDILFRRMRRLAPALIVLDEFALQPLDEPGALRSLAGFELAAAQHGFRKFEDLDLSAQAAPTVDYFLERLPRWRAALLADLGIPGARIDQLIASGEDYRDRYRRGIYGYRLLRFER